MDAFKSMKPKSIMFAAMTIHGAGSLLADKLQKIYSKDEAIKIADLVLEKITGLKSIDRIMKKETRLDDETTRLLHLYVHELAEHKPLQYVLNEAWFAGMKLYVDEHVLIPRPETEELVEWVYNEAARLQLKNIAITDIGTGSGCIAIALKKKLPAATVYATDISNAAIEVAKRNAEANNADIQLIHSNVLDESEWYRLPATEFIVSNPPYIPAAEKSNMPDNVVRFEPHLALFVNDEAPLLFYRALALMAKKKLRRGGKLFVEIHEERGSELKDLFYSLGLKNVETRKDMQQKERMMCVTI